MKTTISLIFIIGFIVASFKSSNQSVKEPLLTRVDSSLEYKELKKPDEKLVAELKKLSTNATKLRNEISYYKQNIKKDSVILGDTFQVKKRFIPRLIDRLK
jgi:peptidoglycan hydrolase CwlO-like protein